VISVPLTKATIGAVRQAINPVTPVIVPSACKRPSASSELGDPVCVEPDRPRTCWRGPFSVKPAHRPAKTCVNDACPQAPRRIWIGSSRDAMGPSIHDATTAAIVLIWPTGEEYDRPGCIAVSWQKAVRAAASRRQACPCQAVQKGQIANQVSRLRIEPEPPGRLPGSED